MTPADFEKLVKTFAANIYSFHSPLNEHIHDIRNEDDPEGYSFDFLARSSGHTFNPFSKSSLICLTYSLEFASRIESCDAMCR